MTPADLTVLLDWITDEIAALEAQDVLTNFERVFVLVWLRAKRRALNAALLAGSGEGEN